MGSSAKRQKDEQDKMFDAVVHYVGGEKKWLAMTAKAGANTDPTVRTKLYEEYKPKAKVGPLMQHLLVKTLCGVRPRVQLLLLHRSGWRADPDALAGVATSPENPNRYEHGC